jgi:methylaspartate mutase epsilon subunit
MNYASPLDKKLRPLSAEQIPAELFAKLREENLARWPTGAEVDLAEAVDYHLSLPDHKRLPWVMRQAESEGRCLTQPRGGFGTLELQIELMKALDKDGLADVVPTTTDSYTRNERWEQAEAGITESEKADRSMLNGFPMVNYGPKRTRQLIEAIDKPGIVLSGTSMPRLTGEVGYAAGFTGYLGSGLAYVTSYTKEMTIEEGIRNYQYLDRLAALYGEMGVELHRRQPGFLTGTNIPPSIAIVTCVIDALLAAAQGVKSYGLEMGQTLHLIQDAAAIHACKELAQEYLNGAGYDDVSTPIISLHWMGAWPQDEAQCAALVAYGGTLAAIGGAASVTTKSAHEAFGIPTPQANAEGLRTTRMAVYLARQIRLDDHPEFTVEVDLIKREVRSIMDKTLELGDGDIALGTVRACEAGVVDIPWSPNRYVKGRVMPARDADGYLRILDPGDMPFEKDVLELHAEKLGRRAAREGVPCDRELAVSSVYEISEALAHLAPSVSGGSKQPVTAK